jgi:glycosyltransferase involved in cell wall biosynthesis
MKKKMRDILVLGYFGYETNQLDGQTVKTRNVHALLELKTGRKVELFDTEMLSYGYKAYLSMVRKLIKSGDILYLPAQRNLRLFLPLLYLMSRLLGIRIFYIVIGGWLPEFVLAHRLHRILLKRINGIFVETSAMYSGLTERLGFNNVAIFPNFRIVDFKPDPGPESPDLKLVFMSRVTPLKGVDRLFALDRLIHQSGKWSKICIDLYGPIDSVYRQSFEEGIKEAHILTYKGILQPDQILSTLASYDAMLFPTRYPGEGCPGAIIDAYIAGIPVIATDWRYNNEFVVNGVTGFVYSPDKVETLFDAVMNLNTDREMLKNMKKAALLKSGEYNSDSAWEILTAKTGIC